ncbi:MAG: GAF domain-containing protein [Bacteroidota bacterium]
MASRRQISDAGRISELEREVSRLSIAVKELAVLNEIAVAAGGKLSVDETLEEVVEKTLKALDAEQGLLLITTDDESRGMKTLVRQDARSSLKRTYHVGIDISGYVLHNSEPLLIRNLARDKRFNASEEERSSIRSVLCVPVFSQGKLAGAMMMTNKMSVECFMEDDQKMLTVVASLVGQLLVPGQRWTPRNVVEDLVLRARIGRRDRTIEFQRRLCLWSRNEDSMNVRSKESR